MWSLPGLLGAIVWDLLTWWWGLPTSSSHALIGGYAGAAIARAALNRGAGKPLLASSSAQWLDQDPHLHRRCSVHGTGPRLRFSSSPSIGFFAPQIAAPGGQAGFASCNLLSAAAYSLGHGGNDAQKTMGIVAGALFTAGIYHLGRDRPANWGQYQVVHHSRRPCRHCAGHLLWRLAHRSHHGFEDHQAEAASADSALKAPGAITLFGTALAGIPVSTTHTITGAIIGVGSDRIVFRRCAGEWRGASCGPGFLRFRLRRRQPGVIFWVIRLVHRPRDVRKALTTKDIKDHEGIACSAGFPFVVPRVLCG